MKNLSGTQTADNLARAFAGESQARNRYTIYAGVAVEEGHHAIAQVFLRIADNERAHAKIFFDLLAAGLGKSAIHVDADYPVGVGTTEQNLSYAAEGEREEWTNVYPAFADLAAQEGFPEVEAAFRKIVGIENNHEQEYLMLQDNMRNGTMYRKADTTQWKCSNCGYVHEGIDAPAACPACRYPQGWFESENQ